MHWEGILHKFSLKTYIHTYIHTHTYMCVPDWTESRWDRKAKNCRKTDSQRRHTSDLFIKDTQILTSCMYVCMYVYLYICMYVVCMTANRIHVCTLWTCYKYVCANLIIKRYVCMYIHLGTLFTECRCMYVCMYVPHLEALERYWGTLVESGVQAS